MIWKDKDVNKISFLPNGIFLVPIESCDTQMEVLNGGYLMFDNKPLIIRKWITDADLTRKAIHTIPIGIKIYGLELKLWGVNCLLKISGLIEVYVKCDQNTRDMKSMTYARVIVEVKLDQKFPKVISFQDEMGKVHHCKVEYDWLSMTCQACQAIEHFTK